MSRVGDTAQRTALALAVIMLLGSLFVTDAHVSLKFPAPASPAPPGPSVSLEHNVTNLKLNRHLCVAGDPPRADNCR